MKLEPETVWYAYRTDGAGMGRDVQAIGYFTSPALAEQARGNNPYSDQRAIRVLRFGDRCFHLDQQRPDSFPLDVDLSSMEEEWKASGLAKLTPEEKRALGLT